MSVTLRVSPSPHIYTDESVPRLMYTVLLALMPALAAAIYYFGMGAIIVTVTSVASCVIFEYLIQRYVLKETPSITDGSALVTGVLLAFNLPANLPIWIIIIGSLVSIGIGKMTFGGLGKNPFNPALVGRAFLLISFPTHMTTWPLPKGFNTSYIDAATGATPLTLLQDGVRNGKSVSALMDQMPSTSKLFFGFMGGSLGEVCAFALILGFIILVWKRIISWHIPVSIITTVALLSGLLWLSNPEQYADPVFHLLTGGIFLGAIFMATDYVTSPMTVKGMWVFGIGIGVLTVIIRAFGSYPEGVSFAILIMNAFVPLLNRYFPPKRYGKEVRNYG